MAAVLGIKETRRLISITRIALSILPIYLAACGVIPAREILPFPDHIIAGVEIGDKIDIVTRDGVASQIIVTDITSDSIVGDGQAVAFEDISGLSKRSWNPIKNPCEDGRPLGCSIPLVVTVLSEYHAEYGSEFQQPCTTHDFCYRFGLKTYGIDKEGCDSEFHVNMRNQCATKIKIDLVGRAQCLLAAKQLYAAVDRYGEKHFHDNSSKYCEYAGPPARVLTK